MIRITYLFGLAYLILGFAGFFLTGSVHKTALIPCAFGVLFLLLAALSHKENLRKHVMHVAVLVALVALLGTARSFRFLPDLLNGTAEKPAAVITQAVNAFLSLGFILLAVRSFIQARRARSFFGNQMAVALMAAGKFPPSPRPRATLAQRKPPTLPTKACPMAAKLHAAIEME